jgi:hypothetical protein
LLAKIHEKISSNITTESEQPAEKRLLAEKTAEEEAEEVKSEEILAVSQILD